MKTPLTAVSGIGPAAASLLQKHGIGSAEKLAACTVKELVKVPGFGPVRSATVLRATRTLLESRDAGGKGKAAKKPKKGKKGATGKGKKKSSKKAPEKKPRKAKKKAAGGKAKGGGKRRKKGKGGKKG
jgi:hypothetical protein